MDMMDDRFGRGDDIGSWEELMLQYSGALRIMETRLQILNDEFQMREKYNPIEHIKTRVKAPESIVRKLRRHGVESTLDNMVQYVNDIAGVRIICSFPSDIYRIADIISRQSDLHVITVKDYFLNPKPSGYMSYHMVVTVPVYLSDRVLETKVEIQIRTVAQDFWASLEHKMNYRFGGNAPEDLRKELVESAKDTARLDDRMMHLNEVIQNYHNEENETDK